MRLVLIQHTQDTYHAGYDHSAVPTPAPVPDPATDDEIDAYAQHLHQSLELPPIPDRTTDLTDVGLCALRHGHSTPWTDAQRRVAMVWRGYETGDGGAKAYWAEQAGLPFPYPRPTRVPKMTQEHVDFTAAQPGTQWLREYGADAPTAMTHALSKVGLVLDDVVRAFAGKGRPTGTAKVLRDDAIAVLADLCPDVVPVAYAADVLGIHRVKLSKALSKGSDGKRVTPVIISEGVLQKTQAQVIAA